MKVVIQHSETLHYWRADGTWVPNYLNAHHFLTASDAISKFKSTTEPYQIVLKFDDSKYDIILMEFNTSKKAPPANPAQSGIQPGV
ncbi:MAG: hypothetical protein JWQ71_1029 [Pedosphaera sp.]|nr:hypothetical protein [Pedosphaera sp.]